jgi:hypothetical protein
VRPRRSLRNSSRVEIEEFETEKVQKVKHSKPSAAAKKQEVVDDDDVPEIVTADDSDILRLKRLHEESTMKPKSKKRRRDVSAKVETPQGESVHHTSPHPRIPLPL